MKTILANMAFAIPVLASAMLALPSQTLATTVQPDATWDAVLHSGNTIGGTGGSTTVGGTVSLNSSGLSATATGTLNLTLLPSVSANTFAAYNSGNASSYVFLESYFTVSGPTGYNVPVIITASGGITQSVITPNQVYLDLGTPTGILSVASACLPAHGNGCGSETVQSSFSGSYAFTLASGKQDNLQLIVSINSNGLFIGSGQTDTQSGYLDPMIEIDPTYQYADLFSIVTSSNVGNCPAATPIPAALPLFASGLGALGLLGWRRKRRASAAIGA